MSNSDYGIIVYWNGKGGYGFVRPDHAERDRFFHVSALKEEVRVGDRVSFERGEDKLHRPCAKSIKVITEDAQEDVQDEREQVAADYQREEETALADALRRAAEERTLERKTPTPTSVPKSSDVDVLG